MENKRSRRKTNKHPRFQKKEKPTHPKRSSCKFKSFWDSCDRYESITSTTSVWAKKLINGSNPTNGNYFQGIRFQTHVTFNLLVKDSTPLWSLDEYREKFWAIWKFIQMVTWKNKLTKIQNRLRVKRSKTCERSQHPFQTSRLDMWQHASRPGLNKNKLARAQIASSQAIQKRNQFTQLAPTKPFNCFTVLLHYA